MQQTLLVYHPSMEDACYNQLTTLHLERHTLEQHGIEKYKSTAVSEVKLYTIYCCVLYHITVLLLPTRCSPATLRMPTMRIASGGRYWLCLWLSSGSLSTQSHGLDGGLSQAWDATESWVSSRDWRKNVFYSQIQWQPRFSYMDTAFSLVYTCVCVAPGSEAALECGWAPPQCWSGVWRGPGLWGSPAGAPRCFPWLVTDAVPSGSPLAPDTHIHTTT